MIDGGMGEIARRQFLSRLRIRGRSAVQTGDPNGIFEHTKYIRAPIFSEDVMKAMRRGIDDRIAQAWSAMPAVTGIGVENFLDLLIVRYRFPNYGGIEQSRTDEQILGFTPFAQPSFVRTAFGLPMHLKNNARLFRSLIRRHCRTLARYPLVKGTVTYPFSFPTVPALVWTKAKAMLGREFIDPTPVDLLTKLNGFVQDLAHSAEVREYAAYDHATILRTVESFFRGKRELAGFVDWWLAFELWRRVMKGR